MEEANRKKRPGRPRGSAKASPQHRIVGIDFNPGPDAEERLRRLFTILLKLEPFPGTDPPPDGAGKKGG